MIFICSSLKVAKISVCTCTRFFSRMSRYKIFLSFSKSGQIVKKSELYKVHSEILCSYVDGTRARDYNYYLVNNYLYVFFFGVFCVCLVCVPDSKMIRNVFVPNT